MPSNDATERDLLLTELEQAKSHPPPIELGRRIDALRRAMDADPPRFHKYEALWVLIAILFVTGALLIVAGLTGFGFTATVSGPAPRYSLESGGPPINVAEIAAGRTLQLLGGIASGLSLLAGFAMIASSQMLRLFIDLQANADRQSFALHAMVQIALLDRSKEADREQIT